MEGTKTYNSDYILHIPMIDCKKLLIESSMHWKSIQGQHQEVNEFVLRITSKKIDQRITFENFSIEILVALVTMSSGNGTSI